MYWFWYFLMASQPYLLLLGLSGILGKEAEDAANDLAMVMGVVFIIIFIVTLVWIFLRSLGLIA